MHGKQRHDRSDDLVLDGKSVIELGIVVVGPPVRSGCGVDQLGADADAFAGAANAALQHVAHSELAPDLSDIRRLALVLEAGITRDDEQLAEPRELRDDVLDDAVGQVLLLGIGAQIGEREDGDGGFVRKGEVGRRRARTDVLSEDPTSPLLPHRAHETDALPRHRLDEALRFASVANRTARRVDAGRHGRVGNDASTPNCSKQIVPADHTLPVSNQVLEEIEGLRLEFARCGRRGTIRGGSCQEHSHQKDSALAAPDGRTQGSPLMLARS